MTLLNTDNILLFNNLDNINEGFRIPDMAYVHGKDFHCFENLGSDCYFSNYWYGDTDAVQKFAEELATYFKNEYDNLPIEPDCYDFHGMVLLWNIGNKSVVANINLHADLSFGGYDNGIAPELEKSLKSSKLKALLFDGNDNSIFDLITSDVSKTIKNILFQVVADDYKSEYITLAKEEGINIKKISS